MSAEAIASTNRKLEEAARRGDAKGMAALYTDDGVAMPPDGPIIKGKAALEQMWGSVLTDMGLTDLSLDTVDLEFDGDTACEIGIATLTLKSPGGDESKAKAKFVVSWKNDGGTWKLHRDIWNNMA